jgi:hypothetical protein
MHNMPQYTSQTGGQGCRKQPAAHEALLFVATLVGSFAGFLAFSRLVGTVWPASWLAIACAATAAGFLAYWRLAGSERSSTPAPVAVRSFLSIAIGTIAISSGFHLFGYMQIPADILSFSESPFVNEIIKAGLGQPPFLDPLDNNSMPYTPGAPLLTYAIAMLLGCQDSIPASRFIQFGYTLFAVLVAAHLCHLLASQVLRPQEYTHEPLWLLLWLAILLLVATEENINQYTFTLHNDGLALLVSMLGFWLIARDTMQRSRWVTIAMLLLPTLGFMCKQNLLMWLGLFAIYRFVSGKYRWKEQVVYLAGTCTIYILLVGGLYLLWGENFVQWVYVSLGVKESSILRIIMHLFDAGVYVGLGLAATWVFLLTLPVARAFLPIWICWLTMFCIELYTSGVAWPPTHLGPGILSATCFFLVALVRIWPQHTDATQLPRHYMREAVIGLAMISMLGAAGHVRPPIDPVPEGVRLQIAAVEDEFRGVDPARVLMDDGSWIYLRENIVMRDRSTPVALRAGKNQPDIDHDLLSATLERIRNRQYDKIIARHLGGDAWSTWYDYQDRGTGVKDAILGNYRVVRRIPAVSGIQNRFWMEGLTSEIWVFLPK